MTQGKSDRLKVVQNKSTGKWRVFNETKGRFEPGEWNTKGGAKDAKDRMSR